MDNKFLKDRAIRKAIVETILRSEDIEFLEEVKEDINNKYDCEVKKIQERNLKSELSLVESNRSISSGLNLNEDEMLLINTLRSENKNELSSNIIKIGEQLKKKNDVIKEQGIELQLKESFINDFISEDEIFTIEQVSRLIGVKGMGRNNLYKFLRDNFIMMTDYDIVNKKAKDNHYKVYQRYIEYGLFKHRLETYRDKKRVKAMVTYKGVKYIYKKLFEKGYITKGLRELEQDCSNFLECKAR